MLRRGSHNEHKNVNKILILQSTKRQHNRIMNLPASKIPTISKQLNSSLLSLLPTFVHKLQEQHHIISKETEKRGKTRKDNTKGRQRKAIYLYVEKSVRCIVIPGWWPHPIDWWHPVRHHWLWSRSIVSRVAKLGQTSLTLHPIL